MSVPVISVIVPAFQAEATIGPCLRALFEAGFPPGEIVVVDDGSPDGTVAAARAAGVEPLRPGGNRGAAKARNAGAAAAAGDVLFFVDSDVLVHDDVRGRLEAFFRDHDGYAGVFGSYDDAPPARGRVSRIRNLLHHHVHQTAPRDATTFWTGCGALRRADFDVAGGFRTEDEMIEDVGLGIRLARLGRRVRLDPDLKCTHLKRWTWIGFARTDYRHRAMPWTRMLLAPENRSFAETLNAGARGKAAVISVGVSLLALPLAIVAPLVGAALALAALAVLVWLERHFLALVTRRWGTGDTIAAVAVLWVHYLCAGAGYARVRLLG